MAEKEKGQITQSDMKEVIGKFKFKGIGVAINVPAEFKDDLAILGFTTAFSKTELSKNTLVFLNDKSEFIGFLDKQLSHIEPDSVLWFAYPKGTSKIKTDINRDILWKTAEPYGIRPVSNIAIDETWSALRFRPIDKVK